jgi:hypothetical protein
MAYIFLNDGGPDANEYENNYVYFDGSNAQTVERIQNVLCCADTNDPEVRSQLIEICTSSVKDDSTRATEFKNNDWVKNFSKILNVLL